MARRYARPSGPEAEEGTAAHWAAAEVAQGRPVAAGTIAPNGVEVDDEMLDAAEVWADLVGPGAVLETPVACPDIHPECWGTPDAYRYTPGVLDVYDLKYGHRPVDPFQNDQLVCYASGILRAASVDGLADQHTRVNFHIVQPRAYHRDGPVRTWSCMASDLRPLINILSGAAHAPDDMLQVSAGCQDCDGRHACAALQYTTLTHADVVLVGGLPVELSPAHAALELRLLHRAAERIAARVTGLEEQVTALLKGGAPVPGYRLEAGSGRERWSVPAPQVIALGSMLGVDLAKPPAAITPGQARKAGMPDAVVASCAERPRGAAKLVPDDGSLARRTFSGGN